uniref:HTH psq-type domain-containing protein n=1 Tax=Heterorhabditis bacteriophora TaxID=37862 RepID=A0A1I7XIA0_HETBA
MRHHVFPAKVPPPQRSGNKVVRGYYTRSQLSEAVKQALLGKMSVTQAAIQYKIPRTTVQKHVSLARKEHQRAIDYRTRNQAIRRGLSGLVRNDGFQEQVATHDGIAEQNKVSRMEFSSEALWYQQPVRIRDQNQSATKVAESALTHTTSKFGSNNFDASSLEMDVAVECEISTEPNNTTKNAGSTSVKENLAGTKIPKN